MTVLIADLVGSTATIRHLDPEEASDLLDASLRVMMTAVRTFGGTVTQQRGDGILAVFGAPRNNGDVPALACAAALDIVGRLADRPATPGLPRLPVRVGIATGPALLRTVHYDHGHHYDANGYVTHLAAKLQAAAQPDTILCDDLTVRITGPRMEFSLPAGGAGAGTALDPAARRLLGFAPQRRGGGWPADHRLHGRDAEVATILDFLSGRGDGQTIMVVSGTSGLGKSAVCNRALDLHARSGGPIIAVPGNRYGVLSPLSVLRVVVGDLLEATRPGLAEPEAFSAWLRTHRPEVPALIRDAAIDLIFRRGGFSPSDQSTGTKGAHLETELTAILVDLASGAGATVFLDDAQWVDGASLRIVIRAAPALGTARVLLATRDSAALPETGPSRRLALVPLELDAVRTWLEAELNPHPGAIAGLLDLARGLGQSALAVRQLIDALSASAGSNARSWAELEHMPLPGPQSEYGGDAVPPAIEFLIGERIDALSPSAYGLIRLAATMGEECPCARLFAMSGSAEADLEAALDELGARRLVFTEAGRNGRRSRFAHSAIRWVSYNRSSRDERRALHARVLDRLVAEDPAGRSVDPAEVASHAELAGRPVESALWHTRAARAAERRGAYEVARSLVDRATRAVGEIGDETLRDREVIRLVPVAVSVAVNAGRSGEAAALIREALAASIRLGDTAAEARVRSGRALALWKAGRHEACRQDARRVMEIAAQSGDEATRLHGALPLVTASFDLGDYPTCIQVGGELLPAVDRKTARGVYAFGEPVNILSSFVGRALLELGREEEAQALLERFGARHDVEPQDFGEAGLQISLGRILLRRQATEHAHGALTLARGWCVRTGISNLRGIATAWLATALVYLDRVEEAARLLAEDAEVSRAEVSGVYAAIHFRTAAALTSARRGDAASALLSAREAVALASTHGERGHLARALLCHAVLGSALEDGDRAPFRDDLDRATELARALGMAPTLAAIDSARALLAGDSEPAEGTGHAPVWPLLARFRLD